MIFAAGLGTRLKPLTDTMPKALVPLAGKPLLQWQVEKLREAGITDIIVNVHHFPDQIIETVRAYHPKRIITLFGSVGDRAQLRREELGTTSGKLADFTVITEDDPGFEDPRRIAEEIATYVEKAGGAGKYVVIPDREEAVAYAVAMLEPGDFLLCCGNGHERFMKVRGKKEPFNEETCIEEALAKRGIKL